MIQEDFSHVLDRPLETLVVDGQESLAKNARTVCP